MKMQDLAPDLLLEIVSNLLLEDGLALATVRSHIISHSLTQSSRQTCRHVWTISDHAIFWIMLLERTRKFRPLPCHPSLDMASLDPAALKALSYKAIHINRVLSQPFIKPTGPARSHPFQGSSILFHVAGTSLVVVEESQKQPPAIICWDYSCDISRASAVIATPVRRTKNHRVFSDCTRTWTYFNTFDDLVIVSLDHSPDFAEVQLKVTYSSHPDLTRFVTISPFRDLAVVQGDRDLIFIDLKSTTPSRKITTGLSLLRVRDLTSLSLFCY